MRDYAKKYSGGASGKRQNIVGRRQGGVHQEGPSRIIGVVTIVAMLLGIVSSFSFAFALQDKLGMLDKGRQEQDVLKAASLKLSAEKESLLQQGKIETASGRLGLFPASEKQKRRP